MTPRTNYLQRFLTPQETDIQNGPWEPGSTGIPVQGHGKPLGRTGWHELAGSTPPPATDYRVNTPSPNLTELMGQSGRYPSVGFPLPKRFGIENVESVLSSYSEVDSSWTEGNFTNLLLGSESTNLGLNDWSNCGSTTQTPRGEFAAPFSPKYNLYSPQRLGADVIRNTHNSYPLAPVTPDDVTQLKCQQNTEFLDFSYDDSSQDKDNTETLLASVVTDAADYSCNDLLQTIDAPSSGAINPPLKENNTTDKEDDRGIDLNKTPQQKRSKRRKHRPKVIKEGKLKKTPRTKVPKESNLEKSSQKRKYVRKKKLEPGTSQQLDAAADVTVPTVKKTSKSCRRRLNFDLQDNRKEENHGQESIHGAHSEAANLKSGYLAGNQETESVSADKGPAENIQSLERPVSTAPPTSSKQNTINVIARSLNMRNASLLQKDSGVNNQEHHSLGKPNRNIFEAHTTHLNLENLRQLAWKNTDQIMERKKDDPNGERGLKRSYLDSIETGSFSESRNCGSFNSWSSKSNDRKRTGNEFYKGEYKTPDTSVDKDGLEHVATEGRNNYAVQGDVRKLNFKKLKGEGFFNPTISKQYIDNQISISELPKAGRMTKTRPNRSIQDHKTTSTALMAHSNLLSPKVQRESPKNGYKDRIETCPSTMLLMESSKATTSSNMVKPSIEDASLLENVSQHQKQISIKARGQQNKHHLADIIDKLTSQLQLLSLSDGSKESDEDNKVAIVPYEGDGTMIPHEGHDPTRKSRLRPKVELDPETDRMWKLIMGKEVSGNTESQDMDKEIFWEEERKVFRGRVDSFTARMHLIQGDRRFSRWKGSVLDSVIGVFLTQNVSDHLSSSAFMSLAARFPLQSENILEQNYQVETSTQVKETEIGLPDLNSPVKCFDDIIRQPVYKQVAESNRIEEQKDSSSQNSSYASVPHVNKDNRSCSGYNSEATCWGNATSINIHSTISNRQRGVPLNLYNNPLTGSLCFGDRYEGFHHRPEEMGCYKKMPELDKSNDLMNSYRVHPRHPHIQIHEVFPNYLPLHLRTNLAAQDCFGLFGDRNISSSPKEKGKDYESQRVAHTAERMSKAILKNVGLPMFQSTEIDPYTYETHSLTHPKNSLPSLSHFNYNQSPLNIDQQGLGTFHVETSSGEGPRRPTETDVTREGCTTDQSACDPKTTVKASDEMNRSKAVGQETDLLTKSVEVHRQEKETLCGKTTGTSTDFQSARKGKTKVEKSNSFDWDSLRKMVQPDGRRKERSKDTMDSLDYEAIRRADVNEISNAIKERGMNNMLAERIKDILNRLVREHGSMDLEWLRDVPPEKAKDYLLSIQGLGLKSVECVRLLTLHHLAFPVDTNVARIAVRLGWAPLQPLPESLQLHLLELYPMLESIQKYIWPRLCKLDQRTLYELHYQMITFGKVFCTKNKPNCNACPMRAECRHFASAFASARLALPGPEEKGIMSFPVPISADKGSAAAINSRQLLPAGREELPGTESGLCNYEPIVEEPTTPDPDTEEVTQSDLEDAFYEDPDEIPTIKLNVQEFTRTLHNYIRENNELHDIDMSKALVALNPEAASIPTVKLKNVSRLRTEHQVYELPDSHHLLRGRDKREPDDPSPYLLAIWTPGETANSVQPPAGWCKFQESGNLCEEKACFSCNSVREVNSQVVRGTLLVPCRTAMRGSFPLNGTYFQVNEVFADHVSSLNPIDVPRAWIWNLPRRTVYFGTSVSTIFRGLSKEEIQYCFWRGFVCVRGFDQMSRAPRPLMARLHFPASKLSKTKVKPNEEADVTRKE